jgi:rsbT antagonist protein RsbS
MPVPILKQGQFQIAMIRASLTDSEWDRFREALLTRIGRDRSRGVIIDVSTMDVMDSFATRSLRGLSQMLHMRGAETVIVGIQPDVAYAMAQLGLRLPDARTALDLESGLELLHEVIDGDLHG